MTDSSIHELSLAEIRAALDNTSAANARRHGLRQECLRRIERCNHILNCTGLLILIYTALTLLLCC